MIAIDTNLLIYAHQAGSSQHASAVRALHKARAGHSGWGFVLPVITEFWRVVTPAGVPGGSSTLAQAEQFLAALSAAGAACWLPFPGFDVRLIAKAREFGVSGYRIFDLQIALMALEAGATEIWTHDHDFIPLPGLAVHDPIAS